MVKKRIRKFSIAFWNLGEPRILFVFAKFFLNGQHYFLAGGGVSKNTGISEVPRCRISSQNHQLIEMPLLSIYSEKFQQHQHGYHNNDINKMLIFYTTSNKKI